MKLNQLHRSNANSDTARTVCDYNDDVVTPLNSKNVRNDGSDDNEANNKPNTPTKTPPVEASVSPELQMLMKSTPATGLPIHTVISGVTDNRKRRARGLLVGDANGDKDALPLPSHASMQWLHGHSPTLPFATDSSPASSNANSRSPNVMCTPTSADSDSSVFRSSQLNSAVDFSFEFDASVAAAASSSLADLTHFRTQLLSGSCCSDSDNSDRFDCCRYSSDDEDSNIVFDDVVPQFEPTAQQQSYACGSLAESISTDGGGPVASSKDSDWEFDIELSPV